MVPVFFVLGVILGLMILGPLPFIVTRRSTPSDIFVFHILSSCAGAAAVRIVSSRMNETPKWVVFACGAVPPLIVSAAWVTLAALVK